MDYVKLTKEKLSIEEITQLVIAPEFGGVSSFIGTTRNHFEGKKVLQLEYEAFEPMAEKELLKICSEIRSKWKVGHIAIYHRLGVVPVSEASVVVAISSEHRKESLNAVQFAIEVLKASVPIWKKEIYDDGESSWKENAECKWQKNTH